jgi:AcrR family transcriptional regulator
MVASIPDLSPAGAGASARRDSHSVQSLLSVAVEVFNVRGYDGTSMEDLAKAAGITKSSIYHHVSGKEELLRLAVARALDGLFSVLDEPEAVEGGAASRLEYVIRRTCHQLVDNLPYVWCSAWSTRFPSGTARRSPQPRTPTPARRSPTHWPPWSSTDCGLRATEEWAARSSAAEAR